jgi:hypothetical protein
MPIPFDQIPIGEGILPDGSQVSFFVDRQTLESLIEHGHTEKYHDSRFLPGAVSEPDAIFKGLRRPNQNDGLCYSVRPASDPAEDDESPAVDVLPRYGVAFLAFVEVRDMGYVVFDWEWRTEDPDEPGHPLGWIDDFAERVYPCT